MPAINVKNLTKKYGDVSAIDEISFHINKGEIVGFLGPNGAGKTTTMKILTCFMPATSGEATVGDHDCYEHNLEVKRKIGYLPENCPLYSEMNVLEYLEYISAMHQIPPENVKNRIKEVSKSCGLEDKLYTDIGELSKGYKQRVGLAQALIHDPEILILDEPTTGLDPNQRIEIRNLIKNIGEKKTVILSSHILPEVEAMCSRVIIIDKGKIVAEGSPIELQQKAKKGTLITVILEGHEDDCRKVLEKVKGISNIENKGKIGEKEYIFEISAENGLDLRKTIIDILQRAKSVFLLEIYKKEASLEDVFTQMTQ
ncbi:hypothetical protein A2335_02095 [Candidatus Peregrinibacteria bacterium RIFOXYB2_FULL_32_7]|nr:MAG: hypothetical protein A2335_02095 [Candidatus Peregrinibacteria bacterium RIFOXYB2_FULL_32_7]